MNENYVKSFKELVVYKKTRDISRRIVKISGTFPKEELYSLTDQIRRSARSIGAQIAEAWGKRRYEKHFLSKLSDADSEQLETQHWVDEAHDCGYLHQSDTDRLTEGLEEIGRLLGGMMEKASLFCSASEPPPPTTDY